MLYVDLFTNLDTADADGTPLSAAIIAAGTQGGASRYNSITEHGIASNCYTIGTSQVAQPALIKVFNDNTFAVGSRTRAFKMDHSTVAFFAVEYNLLSITKVATVAGWFKTSIPDEGVGSQLWDFWKFKDEINGDNVVMQLNSGQGGVGYGMNLETTIAGVPSHSAYINFTPGQPYWCCLQANYGSAVARFAMFDANWNVVTNLTMSQSGPTQSAGNVGILYLGQDEEGLGAYTTYFEDMVISYKGDFPIGPTGSAVKLQNSGKRPRPFAPGNAR